jgi:hypothetical protein
MFPVKLLNKFSRFTQEKITLKLIFPVILVLTVSIVHSQDDSIGIGWIHVTESQHIEFPKAIRKTNNGELIVLASQFYSNLSHNQIEISRLTADGQERWSKCLDVNGGERPNDLELFDNGDFVITGDNWTGTFDTSGNVIWLLEHFEDTRGMGSDIEIHNDDIFVTGTKEDSVFLIKMSHEGNLEFKYTYPKFDHSPMEGKAITILDANTIVLGAEVFDVDFDYVYSRAGLFFLDSLGSCQEMRIYGNELENSPLIDIESSNGNIYVLGIRGGEPGNYWDPYLMLINSSHDEVWVETYDDGLVFSEVYDLFIDEMGNNLICGAAESSDTLHNEDFWVLKCDPSGNLLWDFKYGTEHWERATSIAQLDTECYVFVGDSQRRNSLGGNTSYVIKIGKGLSIIPARGDVDGDGITDVSDVMKIIDHLLRLQILQDDQFERADCNGDGKINVLDVVGVVNVILGISECTP